MVTSNSRIALFLPSLRGGGAERVMVILANGFAEKGHLVDMVLVNAEGPFLDEVDDGVTIINLAVSRTAAALPGLTRYLRTHRPAVLLSTLNHANIIALVANRLAGGHTDIFVREANTARISTRRGAPLKNRVLPFLLRRLYPTGSGVIAVSQGVADDLIEAGIVEEQNVEVIYNPSITPELTELAALPVDHPFYRSHLDVVLGVGSLTPQKDFPTLIEAFRQVLPHHPNARLVILGEGNERRTLEKLINQLGLSDRIDLPGFVENPFCFMANATVYVLSSAWEGLPNTLLQAMGTQVPVVATNCPSGPSEILDGGRWGHLVPVGNISEMAAAISDVLCGRGRNQDPVHLKRFHRDQVVDRYLQTLLRS